MSQTRSRKWGGAIASVASVALAATTFGGALLGTAGAVPGPEGTTVPLIEAQVANPSAQEAFAGCEDVRVMVATDRSGSVAGADPSNIAFMRSALNGFAAQVASVPGVEIAGTTFGTLASGQHDVSDEDWGPVPGPAHELHGQWAGVRAKYPWLSGWKINPTFKPGPFTPGGMEGMPEYIHPDSQEMYPPSPQIDDTENPSAGWLRPTGAGLSDWFQFVNSIDFASYNGANPDLSADPNLSGFTNWAAALGNGTFTNAPFANKVSSNVDDIASTVTGSVQTVDGAKPTDADLFILLTDGAPTVGPTHGAFGWSNDPQRVPAESATNTLNLDAVVTSTNDAIKQADALRAAGVRVEIVTVPVGENSYPDTQLVDAVANDTTAVHQSDYSSLGDTLASIVRDECEPGDVSVAKSADQDPVYDGDNVTWAVDVAWKSQGRTSAPIKVTDTLNKGSLVSMTVAPEFGTSNPDGTVTLKPMTTGQKPVRVTVTSKVDGFNGQTNTATVEQTCAGVADCVVPQGDNPDNNTSTANVPGVVADMMIVKAGPLRYTAGEEVTYTVTATNRGPNTAIGATIKDVAGPGLTLTDVDSDQCKLAADGQSFSCAIGDLESGTSKTLKVTGKVDKDFNAILVNYSETASDTPDDDPTNNTSQKSNPTNPSFDPEHPCEPGYAGCTTSTPIPPSATPLVDVAVTKNLRSGQKVVTGQNVIFDLTLANFGPDSAVNVVSADQPEPGLELVGLKVTDASTGVNVTVDGSKVLADELPSGALVKIEATFKVTAEAGTVKNVFFATNDRPDNNTSNNIDKDSGNPNDPNSPVPEDGTCTVTFQGCSSITVEEVPSAPDSPAKPAPNAPAPPAPNAPDTPAVPLARTGSSTGLLAGGGALVLLAGGLVLLAVRRRKDVPTD